MTSTTTDENLPQDTTDSKEYKKQVKQGEKLYAKLAKARKALKRAQQKLAKAQARLEDNHTAVRELELRLLEFEQEHARQSSTAQAQKTDVAPAPQSGALAEETSLLEDQEQPAAVSNVDTSAPPQEERHDVEEQSDATAPSLKDEQDVVPQQATSTRGSASSRSSRAATSRQRSTRSHSRSSSPKTER